MITPFYSFSLSFSIHPLARPIQKALFSLPISNPLAPPKIKIKTTRKKIRRIPWVPISHAPLLKTYITRLSTFQYTHRGKSTQTEMQPRKSAARALEQIRAARIQSETPIHDTTASAVKRNNRGSKTASPVKQKEEETSPKKPLLSFKLVNREAKSTHNIQGDEGEEGSDEDSLSPPPSEGDQEEDMDDENSDQSQEDSNEGRRGGTQKRKRRRFDQPSPERSSPYNRRGQTKSPSKSPVKSTEPNVFPSEPLITERDHLVNSSHMAGIILFTTIFRPLLELQKMEPLDLETEIMNPESTFTVQLILKLMSFIRVINRIKPT